MKRKVQEKEREGRCEKGTESMNKREERKWKSQ